MSPALAYLADHFEFESRVSVPPTAYGRNAMGYGSRIATPYQVRVNSAGPWRRVYAICWSNAGTLYVTVNNNRYYLRDFDITP